MPETLTVCGCCKGEDGVWRFVCKCGFQAEVWRETPGCPKCGVLWEFGESRGEGSMTPEEVQAVLEAGANRIAAFEKREKAAREALLQAERDEVFDKAEEERRHREIDERLLREAV